MIRMAAVITLSFLAFPASANAQDPDVDCGNATSNVEMTHCGWLEFERADAELNELYQDAISQIRATGSGLPAGADKWEEKLREAQRAWIAFRDLNCDELIAIEWGGGSGTSLATAACRIEMTNARIETLRERYLPR